MLGRRYAAPQVTVFEKCATASQMTHGVENVSINRAWRWKMARADNTDPVRRSRGERTVIFYDPDPVQHFQNSVQVQPQSKLFLKLKVQVQIKSKKFNKIQLFNNKYHAILFHQLSPNPTLIQNLWSNLQSGSNPDSTTFGIVRIQSKSRL